MEVAQDSQWFYLATWKWTGWMLLGSGGCESLELGLLCHSDVSGSPCAKAAAATCSPARLQAFLPHVCLSCRLAGSVFALPRNLPNQAVCSGKDLARALLILLLSSDAPFYFPDLRKFVQLTFWSASHVLPCAKVTFVMQPIYWTCCGGGFQGRWLHAKPF